MQIRDLLNKGVRFAVGGAAGILTGLVIQLVLTSGLGLFYLDSAIIGYGTGFVVNFGSQILLGTVKIQTIRPTRRFSYRYPRNIISHFFQAQRHGYVRAILHRGLNLDIGCGLYKITTDSIGMDMKEWKNPDVVGSAMDIPFKDCHFDSVTLLEVIEHFDAEDQNRIVTEIRRVLKPGGQLVLSMPNMTPFWSLPYRIIWSLWEHLVMSEYLHEHIGMIPRWKLKELLERNGFDVLWFHRAALLDVIVDCRKSIEAPDDSHRESQIEQKLEEVRDEAVVTIRQHPTDFGHREGKADWQPEHYYPEHE